MPEHVRVCVRAMSGNTTRHRTNRAIHAAVQILLGQLPTFYLPTPQAVAPCLIRLQSPVSFCPLLLISIVPMWREVSEKLDTVREPSQII